MAKPGDCVRILIADDHRLFREGLRALLEGEKDLAVVGDACDGAEAIELVARLHPDVLLLDLAMPNMPGLDTLRVLTKGPWPVRVIMLTASIGPDDVVQALQLGARGIVSKEEASEKLLRAIRTVMAGEYWIAHRNVATLVDVWRSVRKPADSTVKKDFGLSARELEIVAAVLAACSNKEIAAKLAISEKTVKNHLTNVFDKLGVSKRLELALFALNHAPDLPDLPSWD
jgi:two-component system nitrate/nitrite response regulator NarL